MASQPWKVLDVLSFPLFTSQELGSVKVPSSSLRSSLKSKNLEASSDFCRVLKGGYSRGEGGSGEPWGK